MFEEKKEEYFAKIPDFIETAGQRQYLKYVLSIGFLGNILMWLAVLFLPSTVFYFFDKLFDLRTELVKIVFLIPFAFGFVVTYALLRLKFPDLENGKQIDEDFMGSYGYQAKSELRWRIYIASGLVGAANGLLLFLFTLLLK